MPYRTCDHLKEDGVYCSSPALRDQRYCYFHLNIRARRVQAARARLHGDAPRFQMPILDNMHAVQTGIQQVADAIADDRISNRRAGLLLYALQQAAASLKSTPEWKGQRPEIAPDEPLRALEINSLHDQYELPYDTDFDAAPDLAAATIEATIGLTHAARRTQTQQPSLARVPAGDGAPEPALSLSKGSPVLRANLGEVQGTPESALSLSKGSPILEANPAEVPDPPASVRKPPAPASPDAVGVATSAA